MPCYVKGCGEAAIKRIRLQDPKTGTPDAETVLVCPGHLKVCQEAEVVADRLAFVAPPPLPVDRPLPGLGRMWGPAVPVSAPRKIENPPCRLCSRHPAKKRSDGKVWCDFCWGEDQVSLSPPTPIHPSKRPAFPPAEPATRLEVEDLSEKPAPVSVATPPVTEPALISSPNPPLLETRMPPELKLKANPTPDGCRIDGCERPIRARGLCDKHYTHAITRHRLEELGLPARKKQGPNKESPSFQRRTSAGSLSRAELEARLNKLALADRIRSQLNPTDPTPVHWQLGSVEGVLDAPMKAAFRALADRLETEALSLGSGS